MRLMVCYYSGIRTLLVGWQMPVNRIQMESGPLGPMYKAYCREVGSYLHSNAYTTYFKGSGTWTNIQQSVTFLLSGFDEDALANGCLALSSKTYSVLRRYAPSGWTVKRWMVGLVLEHHAVNVYRGSPFTGYIFDPWITQNTLVYTYSEWAREMLALQLISNDRAE